MKYSISGTQKIEGVIEAEDRESAKSLFRDQYPEVDVMSIEEIPDFRRLDVPRPKYVKIVAPTGPHCAMAREGEGKTAYWRDAGCWGCETKIIDGKLLIDAPGMDWLDNKPLIEVTNEEWAKDNEGYL